MVRHGPTRAGGRAVSGILRMVKYVAYLWSEGVLIEEDLPGILAARRPERDPRVLLDEIHQRADYA